MVSETSEKALEGLIEAAFLAGGYTLGNNADFDAALALDTKQCQSQSKKGPSRGVKRGHFG